MTTAKGFLLLIAFLCALSGCSTVSQRQSKVLSRAVYATQEALSKGRVDLAKSYNAQAARLLPPPEKRQGIAPVELKGKRYVILPAELKDAPTLAIGSPTLTSLVSEDKALQRQFCAEGKALAQIEKATDGVIAAKEKIVEKAEAAQATARSGFWEKVAFYAKLAVLGLAFLALCFLFPAALPLISAALGSALNLVRGLASALSIQIQKLLSR